MTWIGKDVYGNECMIFVHSIVAVRTVWYSTARENFPDDSIEEKGKCLVVLNGGHDITLDCTYAEFKADLERASREFRAQAMMQGLVQR